MGTPRTMLDSSKIVEGFKRLSDAEGIQHFKLIYI